MAVDAGACISTALAALLYRGLANRLDAPAFALIIGGALGNVTDCISLGYVVDYLDFHRQGRHWPAFNIAEIAIVISSSTLLAEHTKDSGRGCAYATHFA